MVVTILSLLKKRETAMELGLECYASSVILVGSSALVFIEAEGLS
jgi:hypothetical protein